MEIRDDMRSMVPPNSVEAEISVLGAMLQDSGAVLRAAEQLVPEDFYQPEHQEIFRYRLNCPAAGCWRESAESGTC